MNHFDSLKNYDKEMPYWIIDYLAERKTKLMVYWIRKIYNHNSVIRMLDAGCGTGHHLQELYREGYKNLYGMDLSLVQIKQAKKNNLYLEKNITRGDINHIQ